MCDETPYLPARKGVIIGKKRANGEGSLRQLENGSWCCQIMVGFKPDGTRDIRTFSGKTQGGPAQEGRVQK